MRCGSDACHFAEQLHVRRRVVEVIVTNEAAVGLATELTIFFFVQLFEDRTLIPTGSFVPAHRFAQVIFRDIQDANLQHFVGIRVIDQILQSAPRAFEFLKFFVMKNQVHLIRQFFVDCRDQTFNSAECIRRNGVAVRQCLLGKCLNCVFNCAARFVGFRFEFLVQKRGKFAPLKFDLSETGCAL